MIIGTVKYYDDARGFGFLARDDGGPDTFVHRSALGGADIAVGDRIQFDVEQGPKGPRAFDVKLLD